MRRPNRMRIAVWTTVLSLLLSFAPDGSAQSPGPVERANELAREAFRLSREGDQDAAIAKYRAALELAPELHGARFALARLFAGLSRFEEARAEFAALVAANPSDSASRRGEATALILLDRWAEARQSLEDGLRIPPRDGQLAHLLARVLASAPDDAVRNGEMALELAMRVYEIQKKAVVGETVAMAFAELGEYQRAIAIQSEMVRIVKEAAGEERLLALMRERLAAYTRQEPWRAKTPLEIVQSTELPAAKRP